MLCQTDSYQRKHRGNVIACEACDDGFVIQLAETIFYPEGGGQPADRGWIGGVPLQDVQKDGERILHYTQAPVPIGQADLELNWDVRFDYMQQHTGQHLLTAIILKTYGWKTVGFHISADWSTIELETSSIAEEQLREIEALVEAAILEDRPIRQRLVSSEQLEALAIRTRGIPDWVKGPIRLIDIDGYDINNCGGTHLRRTGELQLFSSLRTEKIKKNTRLYFVFGGRVRRMLQGYVKKERALNQIFSQADHVQIAAEWSRQRKESKREHKALRLELAQYRGKALAAAQGDVGVLVLSATSTFEDFHAILREALKVAPHKPYLIANPELFLVHLINEQHHAAHRVQILSLLDGKGGGRAPVIQGRYKAKEGILKVAEHLRGRL